MTAPVVRSYALNYPHLTFVMVSAPLLEPLFSNISNLKFEGIDFKKYSGFWGLYRLYSRLREYRPSIVLDLHQVLRTYVLCALFFFFSVTLIFGVKKGRRQRRRLTKVNCKVLHPLPSMMKRYIDVFIRGGFPPISIDDIPIPKTSFPASHPPLPKNAPSLHIGIAPFAKHPTKEWPIEKMESVVTQLARNGKYRISLFGGGNVERDILKSWEQQYSNTLCVVGIFDFSRELSLIGGVDLFVCMDSANMHFASFMGVPVLSIWGGTHPYAGFYGWRQAPENAIQADMTCRPCSVFGEKTCRLGTFACFQSISVQQVLHRIECFFEQKGV